MPSWNSYHAGDARFVRPGDGMVASIGPAAYAYGKAETPGFIIKTNSGLDATFVPAHDIFAALARQNVTLEELRGFYREAKTCLAPVNVTTVASGVSPQDPEPSRGRKSAQAG